MSSHHIYSFEKLDVYQASLHLSIKMREIAKSFPDSERFDLTRQLKRAVDSIGANLAEGSGRSSNLDQAHFTNMAYASGMEIINHMNLARELKYVNDEIYLGFRKDMDKIVNQLNSLYKYQINNPQNLKTITKREDK